MEIPKIASKPVEESPAFRERPYTMRECEQLEAARDASLTRRFVGV